MLSFIKQQIFPGCYAGHVNRKIISKKYDTQLNFNVDISSIDKDIDRYIKLVERDLENQLDRKKRIEDKAKSLLFIIAVTVTAITFSLSYLKSLQISLFQTISIITLFFSIIYLVSGAIRALQSLNIRKFDILQADIIENEDKGKDKEGKKYVLIKKKSDTEYLKDIIKSKQSNDLINIQLSNFTYASFNLIRNGVILFVVFFMTTIAFTYLSNVKDHSRTYLINKNTKIKIRDTADLVIPYSFEINLNKDTK